MRDKSLRRVKACAGLGVMLLCASACVPIGWVTPPTKLDVGTGISGTDRPDNPSTDFDESKSNTGPRSLLDMRVSAVPLQAIPGREDRLLDVEAGYALRMIFPTTRTTHGPFAGISLMLPVGQSNERVILGTQVQALIGARRNGYTIVGNRLSGRLSFEWSSWHEGPFSECSFSGNEGFCGAGYALGEFGFAPYLEVSRSQLFSGVQWAGTVGVTMRLPASFGGGLIFFDPSDCL